MDVSFVTMDGGGNLPPTLGIAGEVRRRGGTARFLGHEKQRAAITAAGFRFAPYRDGFDYDPAQPRSTFSGVRDLTRLFADRGIGRDALALFASEPADAVVVDCLLWGAALELADAEVPVVSLEHSLGGFFARNARGPIGFLTRLRGTDPVRALQVPSLTLVATREDFEPEALHTGEHLGFVWQGTPVEAAPATDRPRVLVSFSTTSFPGQARALQSVLDALDGLDLDVVVTLGAVNPGELRIPAGVRAERRIDHGELLPTTALVVGHGGHATAARALGYGIPVLVMPMHPLMDQPAVGRAIERLGVGRVLPKSAKPERIRESVQSLLVDRAVRAAAAGLGRSVRERDGAAVAADLLERHAATTSHVG